MTTQDVLSSKYARWIAITVGALTIGAAVIGAGDRHYVPRAEYTLTHQRDSLVQDAKDQRNYAILLGLDSTDKCNRGKREFCR